MGWIFVSTAIPEIFMMVLGAATYTFLSDKAQSAAWNGANPFEALHGQSFIPSWVIVLFLLFAIVQLFGINSLDLYSSGVSLQAMGLRLKRYQAVILDSVLACGLTIYAEFQSTFSLYMKEFVGVIIVWIAPWFGIMIVDWLLRKYRYNAAELQRRDAGSLYFAGKSGVNWKMASHRLRCGPRLCDSRVLQSAAAGQLPLPLDDPRFQPLRRRLRRLTGARCVQRRLVRRGRLLGAHRDHHRGPRVLRAREGDRHRSRKSRCSANEGTRTDDLRRLEPVRPGNPPRALPGDGSDLAVPVLHQPARPVRTKNGNRSECPHHRGVLAQRRAPEARLSNRACRSRRRWRRRRASRRRVAPVEAPVEITSSTMATRLPRTSSIRARSKSSRCSTSVVMERTGSLMASAR